LRLAATRHDIPALPFSGIRNLAAVAAMATPLPKVAALRRATTDASGGVGTPREQRWTPEVMQPSMDAGMVRSVNQHQVLRSVIRAVEVAMVNVLMGLQGIADYLGHNFAVFSNVTTLISHRMFGDMQKDIAVVLNPPAFPPTTTPSTHTLHLRWFTDFGSVTTSPRTEHTTMNIAGCTFDWGATRIAGVCTSHASSIPQMVTHRNMKREVTQCPTK